MPLVRGRVAVLVLLALLCGCAPRADRKALLIGRAQRSQVAFEGAWVEGFKDYGQALFFGRAGCAACHRIGDQGTRFTGPNLGVDPLCASDGRALTERDPVACRPVAERVAARRPGLGPLEYVVESIMDPDRVVAPTYAPKVMKRLDEPPVNLADHEILALAAFVAGGACPKTAEGIAAARGFILPCRQARDERTGQGMP
jgi:hypothetical protein